MNHKDEKILAALLQTGSVTAAAAAVNCSRNTIYKKLDDRDFCEEYERRRREALDAATAALRNGLLSAAEAIRDVLDDPLTQPQTKLNAAQLLLQNAAKYTELCDVTKKIGEIELRLKTILGDENNE